MRQISLVNYMVAARNPEGKDVNVPYDVKNSMIEILFSRDLQLSAREALVRDDLARKIKDCANGNLLLLEEAEYAKLEKAVDTIKGFGRADVEFVRRVLDAKRVEVDVKKENSEGEESETKPVLLKNKPAKVKGKK